MLPDFIVKLSLLIVLILIGIVIFRHKLYYHFSVVEKGKLYRSGALNALRLRLVVRRTAIRTVINLASQEECAAGRWYEEEKEFCRQNQLNLINIPIRPGLPPDPGQIRRFLQIALCPDYQPILVHCKQGVARTGMMVAVYLKQRFGTGNQEILKKLPLFGHSLNGSKRQKIRDFILNYTPPASTADNSPSDNARHKSHVIP